MMFDAIWKRRASCRFVTKPKVVEERIYKSWALYQPRKAGLAMCHMQRPVSLTNPSYTMCGWGTPQMGAFAAHGFSRHMIYQTPKTVKDTVSYGDQIGCSICFDVISDLAAWLELMGAPPVAITSERTWTHLRWDCFANSDTACGMMMRDAAAARDVKKLTVQEWPKAPALDLCPVCKAVFSRLYGIDRPEASYTKFQTLEEARREAELAWENAK